MDWTKGSGRMLEIRKQYEALTPAQRHIADCLIARFTRDLERPRIPRELEPPHPCPDCQQPCRCVPKGRLVICEHVCEVKS